jgi:hypothetical protein
LSLFGSANRQESRPATACRKFTAISIRRRIHSRHERATQVVRWKWVHGPARERSKTENDPRLNGLATRAGYQTEHIMKLSSNQVKQTLSQFQAEVLPDNHPAVAQLNNLFGEHTFFLDDGGLKVLEPVGVPEMETRTGEVVSLADWSDATLTSLRPHEPEMTGVVVVLDATKH